MSLPFVVDLERIAPYAAGAHAPAVVRERGVEVVGLASIESPLPSVPGAQDAMAGTRDEIQFFLDTPAEIAAAVRG